MSGIVDEVVSRADDPGPLKGYSTEGPTRGARLVERQAYSPEQDMEYLDREAMKAEFFGLIDAMCQ